MAVVCPTVLLGHAEASLDEGAVGGYGACNAELRLLEHGVHAMCGCNASRQNLSVMPPSHNAKKEPKETHLGATMGWADATWSGG